MMLAAGAERATIANVLSRGGMKGMWKNISAKFRPAHGANPGRLAGAPIRSPK
jgi:hypothetical protein